MWTVKHMFAPVLISTAVLLTAFYFIDNRFFKQESIAQDTLRQQENPKNRHLRQMELPPAFGRGRRGSNVLL